METWWPPVAAALRALGQLYGALDSRTFGGLAQDAVAAATASVQSASRAVAKRKHAHSKCYGQCTAPACCHCNQGAVGFPAEIVHRICSAMLLRYINVLAQGAGRWTASCS